MFPGIGNFTSGNKFQVKRGLVKIIATHIFANRACTEGEAVSSADKILNAANDLYVAEEKKWLAEQKAKQKKRDELMREYQKEMQKTFGSRPNSLGGMHPLGINDAMNDYADPSSFGIIGGMPGGDMDEQIEGLEIKIAEAKKKSKG